MSLESSFCSGNSWWIGQDSNKQVVYTCSEFALQEMRRLNGLDDQESECVCFICRGELYLIEGK